MILTPGMAAEILGKVQKYAASGFGGQVFYACFMRDSEKLDASCVPNIVSSIECDASQT
jgi:hypothetical protein